MNNYKLLQQVMGLAMCGTSLQPSKHHPLPIRKTPPKDWNHTHFFNEHSSIRYTKNENTVFSCRASNDKNAIKKYETWLKNKQQQNNEQQQ